jgi:putative oxidoreductase
MTSMGIPAKDLSFVPARAALGATMVYHGLGKLRGEGPAQAGSMFEGLGIRPGKPWAIATGVAEVFAGATAILGLGTRLGALAVIATQAVAIGKVHRGKGFDNTAGGWEFNAALIALAAMLLLGGPGRVSAHELVEHRVEGPGGWRRLARPRRRAARWVRLLK